VRISTRSLALPGSSLALAARRPRAHAHARPRLALRLLAARLRHCGEGRRARSPQRPVSVTLGLVAGRGLDRRAVELLTAGRAER